MRCPECQFDNQAEDVFCSECGTRLSASQALRKCLRCSAIASAEARFCQMCAAPLGAPPPENVEPAATLAPPAPAPPAASAEVAAPLPSGGGPPGAKPTAAKPAVRPVLMVALAAVAAGVVGFEGASHYKGQWAAAPTPRPSVVASRSVAPATPLPSPSAVAAPPLDERKVVRLGGIKVRASSHQVPLGPSRAVDGKTDTWWCSGETSGADWLLLDFKRRVVVSRVGIICGRADAGDKAFRDHVRVRSVQLELDGDVEVQGNLSDSPKMQFIRLNAPVATRKVRVVITSVRAGGRFHQVIIPEIEVWGREG